ncbi:MAG: hypothetical protein IT292_04950 [Deltaproteobacteria bacterium]|nr:hypothetical protein [Deltaproteobacteria bacterium]
MKTNHAGEINIGKLILIAITLYMLYGVVVYSKMSSQLEQATKYSQDTLSNVDSADSIEISSFPTKILAKYKSQGYCRSLEFKSFNRLASACYDIAIAFNLKSSQAWLNKANFLEETNKHNEALEYFDIIDKCFTNKLAIDNQSLPTTDCVELGE